MFLLASMGVLTTGVLLSAALAIHTSGQGASSRRQVSALGEHHRHAELVLARCRAESSRPSCYDREIPKLMDAMSMEEAFAITKIVQDKDPAYRFCHVLGHELSAREVKKDPNEWKTVLARCPSGVCSNGCIHGGLQERFRAESLTDAQIGQLIPDLQTLCEAQGARQPTGLERGTCYHALGHLTMYMTNGDIRKSVGLCENITKNAPGEAFHHVCLDGAFMQIFQPLEPEDFALVKGKQPTKEVLGAFCHPFSGEARGSCLSEAWPLFAEEIKQPNGLVAFCDREELSERDRCYTGLFYVLTVQLGFDTSALEDFCAALPDARRGQCASQVASRLIETDYRNIAAAVQFCALAAAYGSSAACFNNMVAEAAFNFHPGSPQFLELCSALPEAWKQQCLSRWK